MEEDVSSGPATGKADYGIGNVTVKLYFINILAVNQKF